MGCIGSKSINTSKQKGFLRKNQQLLKQCQIQQERYKRELKACLARPNDQSAKIRIKTISSNMAENARNIREYQKTLDYAQITKQNLKTLQSDQLAVKTRQEYKKQFEKTAIKSYSIKAQQKMQQFNQMHNLQKQAFQDVSSQISTKCDQSQNKNALDGYNDLNQPNDEAAKILQQVQNEMKEQKPQQFYKGGPPPPTGPPPGPPPGPLVTPPLYMYQPQQIYGNRPPQTYPQQQPQQLYGGGQPPYVQQQHYQQQQQLQQQQQQQQQYGYVPPPPSY